MGVCTSSTTAASREQRVSSTTAASRENGVSTTTAPSRGKRVSAPAVLDVPVTSGTAPSTPSGISTGLTPRARPDAAGSAAACSSSDDPPVQLGPETRKNWLALLGLVQCCNALHDAVGQALPRNAMARYASHGPATGVRQNVTDVPALMAAAAQARTEFSSALRHVVRGAGLDPDAAVTQDGRALAPHRATVTGPVPQDGAWYVKVVQREHGGDAGRLVNAVQGCVLVSTEEQLEQMAEALQRLDVVQLENGFAEPLWTGYREALYYVRVHAHICEVRLQLASLLPHREASETYYERFRAFFAGPHDVCERRMRAVERLVADSSDVEGRVRSVLRSSDAALLQDMAALAQTMRDYPLLLLVGARLRELEPANAAYAFAVGSATAQCGDLATAQAVLHDCLTQRQATCGATDPETVRTLRHLAAVLRGRGQCEAAEGLYEGCWARQRATLGAAHHETLRTLHALAVCAQSRGAAPKAEGLYRECLAHRRATLGPAHPDTLATLNNLAHVMQRQGGSREAEALYRECWAAHRAALGDAHPTTLTAGHNLAVVLQTRGQAQEAEALYRDCLARRHAVLGDAHAATLTTLNNVAVVLQGYGRAREAEGLYRECLAKRQAALGDGHPDTLTTLSNLANSLQDQGRASEAEGLYRQCLERRRAALGERHPDTLRTGHNLAVVLQGLGRGGG